MLKTPMSALNEFCMKHDVIPHYELVEEKLPKMYMCTLTFSGHLLDHITATGQARTKQNAKHLAAYDVLKSIHTENTNGAIKCTCFELDNILSPGNNETEQNYVKELKDVCMFNFLPEPDYSFVNVEGTHKKTFLMKCTVSSLEEVAAAGNKKLAKQYAANFMFNKLINLQKMKLITEMPKLNKLEPITNGNINPNNSMGILKEVIKISPQNIYRHSKVKIDDQYNIFALEEEFYPLNYVITHRLNKLEGDIDASSELQEISKLSEVDYRFRLITIKSRNGKCLVELIFLTPPPLVVVGIGLNKQQAETFASQRMLKYLKEFV